MMPSLITTAYHYLQQDPARFYATLGHHILLSMSALLVAGLLSVSLGLWSARRERFSEALMAGFNALRVIPSLAILALSLPILGTGILPALLALVLLACPPILINTCLGFRQVPADILEAARGMGMDARTVLLRIELPFALSSILAGLRTAAVEVISGATLAAFIGGGGLGTYIINGLSMADMPLLLLGAVPVAGLAILTEAGFAWLERALIAPDGRLQLC